MKNWAYVGLLATFAAELVSHALGKRGWQFALPVLLATAIVTLVGSAHPPKPERFYKRSGAPALTRYQVKEVSRMIGDSRFP